MEQRKPFDPNYTCVTPKPRTLSRVTCPRHANMSQQPPPCHAVKTVFRHLQCFLRQLVFFLVSKNVTMVSPWCHHRDTRDLYHQDIIVMSLLSFIFIPLISIWIYTCIKFRVWGYLTFPDPPEWLIKNHFMLHIFKSCAQIVLTETAAIVLTKYAFWWFSVFWTLGFVRLPLPRGGETSHQWKIWLIWW